MWINLRQKIVPSKVLFLFFYLNCSAQMFWETTEPLLKIELYLSPFRKVTSSAEPSDLGARNHRHTLCLLVLKLFLYSLKKYFPVKLFHIKIQENCLTKTFPTSDIMVYVVCDRRGCTYLFLRSVFQRHIWGTFGHHCLFKMHLHILTLTGGNNKVLLRLIAQIFGSK